MRVTNFFTNQIFFTKPTHSRIKLSGMLFLIILFSSCKKESKSDTQITSPVIQTSISNSAKIPISMVLIWNEAATVAIAQMAPLTGSGPLPPMPESRFYAMVNIAMHDALNTIQPKYERYALTIPIQKDASPDAAVAQAAHDIIVSEFPPQQAYADALLQTSLNSIPDGDAKTKGINLGKASATAMIVKRQNDGVANAQFNLAQGILPGQYRSTPPFDGSPFNGFMAVPGWGNITPFSLSSGSAFRPVAPYAINSVQYTADFNEIKSLGSSNSTARTPDQTQIALFWMENAPLGWNRITRDLIINRNMNQWESARLLALLQMAEADANIAALNAKYYYLYWRPITAVRLADSDGNPDTHGDPTWDVLAPPTPPVPDYPSNHAVNGGAAGQLLEEFFHHDEIHFTATSSSLPGVTRSFKSMSEAERENSLSRIYIGYHFRCAVIEGEKQGEQIGSYVFNNSLRPL